MHASDCAQFIATALHHHELTNVLLNAALPPHIVQKLRTETQLPIAEHYDNISILFLDIVGFTPYAASMPPSDLVAVLSDVFGAFDTITTQVGYVAAVCFALLNCVTAC